MAADRRTFLRLGAVSGLGALAGCASQGAARRALHPADGGFTLLTVEGSAHERGRAHGKALRSSIQRTVELWRTSLSNPEGVTPEQYLASFTAETDFASAMGAHTPELVEELHGIAAGSGIPFETIHALQLLDEEWCYAARKQWEESGAGDKCSVLALARTERHPTFVAQNLDIPEALGREVVLMRHVDERRGLDALVLTIPGVIALNGMNRHGVAVCVNALLPLRSASTGLPVAAVIRGVLERADLAAAAAFVERGPHASPQSYTLGDPAGIACLEASAGKVARVLEGAGELAHTNHPLANDDLGALGRWVAEQPAGSLPGLRNSGARLEACQARLAGDTADPLTVMKAALGSHDREDDPVCRHRAPEKALTAASTIYELREGRPTLHVAANPPCSGDYRAHSI